MAKKVFARIWKTFMITVNSVYGLLLTLYGFVTLVNDDLNQHTWECVVASFIVILMVNWLNHLSIKKIENY